MLLLGGMNLGFLRRAAAVDLDADGTVGIIVDILIPADDLPGAAALGIDRQIVSEADLQLSTLIADGSRWLDAAARGLKSLNFRELDRSEQISLLEHAEESGNTAGARLFALLRRKAMLLYYSHPRIVAAVSYAGPPQPDGFPDFGKPPREH